MNSAVLFFFVAVAAFAADAAIVPLNGAWGSSFFGNGLPLSGMFANGGISPISGTNFALGPVNTIKIVPASSLVSTAATSAPTTQVVQSPVNNFPSVIYPAPGVRCVCTPTDVQPTMSVRSFGFNF